jgi:hypothetical protein
MQVTNFESNEVLSDYQHTEEEDKDGLQNIGFFHIQPLDSADSLRELHHTQSPGKQQTLQMLKIPHVSSLNEGFHSYILFHIITINVTESLHE